MVESRIVFHLSGGGQLAAGLQAFDQHRRVIENDRLGMLVDDLSSHAGLLTGHSRMDDGAELAELGPVLKDDSGQRGPVQGSVWTKNPLPERSDNFPPGRLIRFDHK